MNREAELSNAFLDLADTLVSDYDVADLLYRLVEHAVGLLDVDDAGLMLSDQRGGLQVMASLNEQARLLELLQLQADEGPCLTCYRTGEPVIVPDLHENSTQWPQFASAALDQGYAAVHAVPLRLREHVLGALNLFSRQPGRLSEDDLHVGRALAAAATITLLHEQSLHRHETVIEQLEGALNTRVVIEQAKGVLAASGGVGMDEAFRALRNHARSSGAKLAEVAREVAEGHLDPQLVLRAAAQPSTAEAPAGRMHQ